MTGLLIILSLVLFGIIIVQIGRVSELANSIRGEEEAQESTNKKQGVYSLLFMILFLVFCVVSAYIYRNYMLGYGPHESASAHGKTLDRLFNTTLIVTGIVFIVTHIALFWYAYKYRGMRNRKAAYISHDNKLEIIWTAIPAVVMALLVIGGLDAWNEVMADVKEGEDHIEIEASGYQFAWLLRYPGADGQLGARNFKLIKPGVNELGQDWNDKKNIDDFLPDKIVLPKGKKVRVRITARDVLHNFYLPHFRVKMDAVPGMPTYFVFTPEKTTAEYRKELKKFKEYNVPSDPADPNGPKLWETFNYELACAELCGQGHYSMRRIVEIVEQDEYDAWLAEQKSFYLSNIRNTEEDPWKNVVHDVEVGMRKEAFDAAVETAVTDTSANAKIIRLDYVTFETGSDKLTDISRYELENLVAVMNKYKGMRIEVAGHTDNVGDAGANQTLSEARARSVYNYLTGKGIDGSRLNARGYGQTKPVDTNDTEEGRAKNRRTEFQILSTGSTENI